MGWTGLVREEVLSWNKNLISLELQFELCAQDISIITLLQSLNKLCINLHSDISNAELSELWKLNNLKELCLLRIYTEAQLHRNPCLQRMVQNINLFGVITSIQRIPFLCWIQRRILGLKVTDRLDKLQSLIEDW